MKVATWNVNSLRSRLAHVTDWLQSNPVDALCLQETKVTDEQFPREPLEALGYHCYFSGQKSYNGVAILTRSPLDSVSYGFAPMLTDPQAAIVVPESGGEPVNLDEQKRVISGVLQGVRLVNLYVPNGSSIGSDKYHYKLCWLEVLYQYLKMLLIQADWISVCGDFNIALEDRDIYDASGKEEHIMASPQERQALQRILALGFTDAFRQFNQAEGQFSWWDYRAGSFRRNQGWRIDHHYVSAALVDRTVGCVIDQAPRKLEKPSDHTPVILELQA